MLVDLKPSAQNGAEAAGVAVSKMSENLTLVVLMSALISACETTLFCQEWVSKCEWD